MANILYPPPRPQSVGEILDSTFRIFGATLLKCLPYAILGVIVGQLGSLYDLLKNGRPRLDPVSRLALVQDRRWWLASLIGFVLALVFTNAVILRQFSLASGREVAAGVELRRAVGRVPGVLLIFILMMLSMVGTMIPVTVIVAVPLGLAAGGAALGAGQQGALWGTVIFLLLALIAISWIVIRWICSTAVYLLTARGPLASMGYSWRLTSGSFWRLSVIYTVAVVLMLVFYLIASVLGTAVAAAIANGDLAVMTAVMSTVIVLLGAFAAPFYSALMLSVYGDLTVRREGADLAQRIAAG